MTLRSRPALVLVALATLAGSASARPGRSRHKPAATLPAVGEALPLSGATAWPRLSWLGAAPSATASEGKVIVHWFCERSRACSEDVVRMRKLGKDDRVYIVAHINGGKSSARELDPFDGRGPISFGKGTKTLTKQLRAAGPTSIVVDLEGKVALIARGGRDADARDAKVEELLGTARELTVSATTAPDAAARDKHELRLTGELSNGLSYRDPETAKIKLTVPATMACDTSEITGDKIRFDGRTLTATVTCRAPKGSYEVHGDVEVGYKTKTGGEGSATERVTWSVSNAGEEVAAAEVHAKETPVAPKRGKKPSRFYGFLAAAMPQYIWVEPTGEPPAKTFNATERTNIAAAVGIGYGLTKRLSIGAQAMFIETLYSTNGKTGWFSGKAAIVASLRVWKGLSVGAGPLYSYRAFFNYEPDYGAYYSLGYRFSLPGDFSLMAVVSSVQCYVHKPLVVVSTGMGLSHRF